MDLSSYVIDQALVLIPVLYVIGYIIKQSMVNNKYIPIILVAVGIALSIALLGANIQSIIQGILVAGVTVLGDQVVKQLNKDN